jgi:hypothetical protein
MNTIRATVLEILSKNRPGSMFWQSAWKKLLIAAFLAVMLLILVVFWWPDAQTQAPTPGPTAAAAQKTTSSENKNAPTPAEMGQQMKLAFELGENKDVAGLIRILQTGSYPAQLIAAKYLGQCADKSAINALDQAAQKWYAHETNETNPFIEAIKAIENRAKVRQRLEAELEKIKAQQTKEKSAEQQEDSSLPETAESNRSGTEPNQAEAVPAVTEILTPIFQQPDLIVPEDLTPVHAIPATDPNRLIPQEQQNEVEPGISLPVSDPNLMNDELVL